MIRNDPIDISDIRCPWPRHQQLLEESYAFNAQLLQRKQQLRRRLSAMKMFNSELPRLRQNLAKALARRAEGEPGAGSFLGKWWEDGDGKWWSNREDMMIGKGGSNWDQSNNINKQHQSMGVCCRFLTRHMWMMGMMGMIMFTVSWSPYKQNRW